MIYEIAATPHEDSPFFVMFDIRGISGQAVNQSSITNIVAKIYDIDSETPNTATNEATLTPATVIFNTYQTDSRWTKGSPGYNFGHSVPGAWLPLGDRKYEIEYLVTPTSGDPYYLPVVKIRTLARRSS